MTIRTKIIGKPTLMAKLKKLPEVMQKEVKAAVAKSALLLETEVKREIQTGVKTGRVYNRGGVSHQASAPGQAPATDTGLLVSSYHTVFANQGFTAFVGSNLDYAAHLEHGTSRIEPRPVLFPVYEGNKKIIITNIQQAILRANRSVSRK